MSETYHWRAAYFGELAPGELYEMLALRSAVFVVEQACVYQDLDGLDRQAIHLLARAAEGALVAYARCLPPGLRYPESALGRILVVPELRGGTLGRELVTRGIRLSLSRWPGSGIRINAQAALQDYYSRLGFTAQGDEYDERGIAHLEMLWSGSAD
jgi:ElaA protein